MSSCGCPREQCTNDPVANFGGTGTIGNNHHGF
jgi:hypothetical protein